MTIDTRNWARAGMRELLQYLQWGGYIDEREKKAGWTWLMLAGDRADATVEYCRTMNEIPYGSRELLQDLERSNHLLWPTCDGTEALGFCDGEEFCPLCSVLQDLATDHFLYETIDWVEVDNSRHGLVLLSHVDVEDWICRASDIMERAEHPGFGLVEFLCEETNDGFALVRVAMAEAEPDRVYVWWNAYHRISQNVSVPRSDSLRMLRDGVIERGDDDTLWIAGEHELGCVSNYLTDWDPSTDRSVPLCEECWAKYYGGDKPR